MQIYFGLAFDLGYVFEQLNTLWQLGDLALELFL